jgi:hypothetical protein
MEKVILFHTEKIGAKNLYHDDTKSACRIINFKELADS